MRSNNSPKGPLLKVSIKFCGQCNPQIRSADIAGLIQKQLVNNDSIHFCDNKDEASMLLVISGCPHDCAKRVDRNFLEVAVAGESVNQNYCHQKKIPSEVVKLILQVINGKNI